MSFVNRRISVIKLTVLKIYYKPIDERWGLYDFLDPGKETQYALLYTEENSVSNCTWVNGLTQVQAQVWVGVNDMV